MKKHLPKLGHILVSLRRGRLRNRTSKHIRFSNSHHSLSTESEPFDISSSHKNGFSLPGGRLGKLFYCLPFWKRLNKKQRLYFQMGLGALLVVLVPLAVVTLRQPDKAAASWFNESWLYRQSVGITNSSGSNQTNFQVSFTLDTATLITAGKMQSNCNDLRLTDINSQSIPYWIEENNPGCNSATTKVWTKVPSISTSGTTVYVYYGNPSASNGSNGSKVFDFFDDFNGTGVSGAWARAGNPIVSGGSATLATSSALISKGIVSNTTIQETVGFRMKTSTTSASVVRAGFSDNNNPSTGFATADSAHVLIGSESTYQTSISPSSLVSYHQLEETTTTDANQFKASGYLDTGKLSQAVSVYGNAAGTSGSTLTFNRGAQINGNNYEHINTNQGTISIWVKPNWNGNDGVIHYLYTAGENTGSIKILKSTNNRLYFSSPGIADFTNVDISSWTSGTWYYITARWDADNAVSGSNYACLGVNGSETCGRTSSWAAQVPLAQNIIGAYDTGTSQFQGLIDDFAIFDRVLTTTEITDIYNSGTGKEAGSYADPSLKFYAKMDGSGTLSPVTYNGGASASKITATSSELTGGTNLVLNGNMEAASSGMPTGWVTRGTGNVNAADAESSNIGFDTRSQKISPDAGWTGIQQNITFAANTTYTYSFWYKATTSVTGFEWIVHDGATQIAAGDYPATATWTRKEIVFKTGASAGAGNIQFRSGGSVTDLVAYVDNVSLTPNLVDNGGMEIAGANPPAISSWSQDTANGATVTQDTTPSTGTYGVKIVGGTSNAGSIWQRPSVTAGNYYLFTGWSKGNGTTAARYGVYDLTNGGWIRTPISTGNVTTTYTKFSYIFKAPAGTTQVELDLMAYDGAGLTIYFDDVSLIPLDNTALSFQSWTPADDSASAANDLSVHGDSDGVTSTVSQWTNAYNFDGSTGYLRQKVYDTNIGTLTYADTNTDISDTGQEFGDWDNDSGAAEYMIVVTNSDNTTSWGYFCANDGGTQTAVYTLKACTGGSEGFNGTSPSGKTPVGYEIRKTDYQNFGNAFTVGAWAYFDAIDDVKPVVAKWGTPAGGHSNKSFLLGAVVNNFSLQMAKDGVTDTCSADAAGSTGSWVFLVGTYDGTNVRLYKNGSLAATSSTCSGTIYDGAADFEVGSTTNWWDGKRVFDGNIDSPFVTNTALSADQIMALYNARQKYGLANSQSGAYGFGTSATALDTNYHTFEISQGASSTIFSEDGGAGITSSTNSPTTSQYVRLENTDSTNLAYVDYVYVRKYAATAPVVGSPSTEEKGPGPVAYWKFDDGQGTNAQDSSSSGNDGTITGATWQPEDRCVAEKCLKFDGTDDQVTVASSGSFDFGTDNFSFSFWIRDAGTTANNKIISRYQDADNRWYVAIDASGQIYTYVRDSATNLVSEGGNTNIQDNKWHHVSIVFNKGTGYYLYIDGKLDKSGTATAGNYDNTGNIQIGAYNTSLFYNGTLDEFKIYPYARTAAQVKTDYLAGKANAAAHSGTSAAIGSNPSAWISDGLVGYWKMDDAGIDAEGETITDSSGNSNTGTLYGDNSTGDNGTGLDCTAAGKYGSGCTLDGTDDYITAADSPSLDITGDMTVSMWVNPGATQKNYANLLSKHANGAYTIEQNNATANQFYFSWDTTGSGDWTGNSVTTTLTASTWQLFTIVKNGATVTHYVNGAQTATGAGSSATISANNVALRIGDWSSGSGRQFNGSLDEIRVYNRALSSKEVSDLYNWAPGPVGYWRMDDKVSGASKTIVDVSGNGNNGTTYSANGTGMNCNIAGKYGGGCSFDGADDYIDMGNQSSLNAVDNMTMSFWYKTSAIGVSQIISKATAGYEIYMHTSNNKLNSYFGGAATTADVGIRLNSWTYISYAKTGTNIKVYENGILVADKSLSSTPIFSNSSSLNIGRRSVSAIQYFSGILDDVKIYNYARTQKQITEDMLGGGSLLGNPRGLGTSTPGVGAVGWWKFDEGYGQFANNSGSQGLALRGALGTDSSAGSDDPTWTTSGKFGKALSFDGGDYIEIADNDAFDPTEITISAWFNPTSLAAASVPISHGNNTNGWYLQLNTNGTFGFYTGSSGKTSVRGTVSTGSWQHVVVTHDGINDKFYINGKLTDTLAQTTAITNLSQVFRMGRWSNGNYYYNGLLDEVKIYSYALTSDEVKTEYNRGSAMIVGSLSNTSSLTGGNIASNSASAEYCIPGDSAVCTAPVGEWNFEEGKDNTCTGGTNDVCDKSGNGNDGAWNGTGSHWAAGKVGKAGKFNGSDDYVDTGNNTIFNISSQITLSAWAKSSSSAFQEIIWKNDDPPSVTPNWGNLYNMAIYQGKLYSTYALGDTKTPFSKQGQTLINDGRWHYLVSVFNSTTNSVLLYVDGKLDGSRTDTSGTIPTSTQKVYIGAGLPTYNNIYFNGSIDQVKVFNYARSAAQIAWDYNRGKPVGWWKFDECQGATANDSSGNLNSGTITISGSGTQTTGGTCSTPTDGTGAWYNGRTGKRNASLNFDGIDDYVDVGTNKAVYSFQKTNSFSASAWIKPNTGMSNYSAIIQNQSSSTFAGWNFGIYANHGLEVTLASSGTDKYFVTVSQGLNLSSWNHVIMTYDGSGDASGIKIYINGVNQTLTINDNDAGASINYSSATTEIGRRSYSGLYFDGQVDDAKIFNYALSPTQVKTEYNNGAVNFAPVTGAP